MNNICVIYDQDEQYAKRLMHVMGDSSRINCGVQVFTRENELRTYLDHNEPEILMVSEECYNDELSHRFTGKTIILTDEEGVQDKQYDDPDHQGTVGVYKYQSSEQILREVIRQANTQCERASGRTELIGIFTPAQPTGKTAFSLNLARELSESCRVLYLCLDEFSGLDEILPSEGAVTLSDAVYYYRQNRGQIDEKILATIQSMQNLDYIAPVQCAEDISYLEPERLASFLIQLGEQAGYDKVVIDISYAVRQQWKIIMECTKVYMPVEDDYLSQKRVQAFELYFMAQGMEKLLSRIEKVRLPEAHGLLNKNFWQNEVGGEMRQYVRKIL